MGRNCQPLGLLRRKIMDRAHHGSSEGHRFIGNDPGNAEVNDFRDHSLGQHDILGFDIAMDDVVFMGMIQGRCQLGRQRHRQGRIHSAVLLFKSFQADPFHIFH